MYNIVTKLYLLRFAKHDNNINVNTFLLKILSGPIQFVQILCYTCYYFITIKYYST